MPPAQGHAQLNCPIGLFERIEPEIQTITARMNQAPAPGEKAEYARGLLAKVERLLECESFDDGNLNCRMCRDVSNLRRQTATLILKMAATTGKRGAK
ncbi:MAG: hypothetical protein WBP94_19460 [Rhodomicrobiaceae bacterium]